MQSEYKSEGLVVVGVTQASEADVRKFQLELGATYPILSEGDINFERFGVKAIPEAFLITPDGTVVAQGMEEIDAELEQRFSK